MLASIDWTNVLVALIAGLPAIIAAFYAREGHRQAKDNRSQLQTPSGDSIGQVVERTHDLAAVATLANVAAPAPGAAAQPQVEPTSSMENSVRRLNGDDNSPVHVNGEETQA